MIFASQFGGKLSKISCPTHTLANFMLIFMRTYDLVQIYFEMEENAFFVFYQIKQIPIQYARDSC